MTGLRRFSEHFIDAVEMRWMLWQHVMEERMYGRKDGGKTRKKEKSYLLNASKAMSSSPHTLTVHTNKPHTHAVHEYTVIQLNSVQKHTGIL